MGALRSLSSLVLLLSLAACAARLPPASTFDAQSWSQVETLRPDTWLRVRYVGGSPPLRRTFNGALVSAGSGVLEIRTSDGIQRLLPQRVTQVAVVDPRGPRLLPVAGLSALAGAVLGSFVAQVNEQNRATSRRTTIRAAVVTGLIGAAIAYQTRGARPVIVYSRKASL